MFMFYAKQMFYNPKIPSLTMSNATLLNHQPRQTRREHDVTPMLKTKSNQYFYITSILYYFYLRNDQPHVYVLQIWQAQLLLSIKNPKRRNVPIFTWNSSSSIEVIGLGHDGVAENKWWWRCVSTPEKIKSLWRCKNWIGTS